MLEKLNYKINSKIIIPSGPINGQGLKPIADCRYGLCPASFNACEMIAIYNLLEINNIHDYSFPDICLEMYKKVWALWGFFGSNVYLLDKFFIAHKIKITKTYNRNNFFRQLNDNHSGIISFWNSNNPLDGVHTVCVEKVNDKYKIYNRYNNRSYACTYSTWDEIVSPYRFMVGYIKIDQR